MFIAPSAIFAPVTTIVFLTRLNIPTLRTILTTVLLGMFAFLFLLLTASAITLLLCLIAASATLITP
jgi:hypothetical protein